VARPTLLLGQASSTELCSLVAREILAAKEIARNHACEGIAWSPATRPARKIVPAAHALPFVFVFACWCTIQGPLLGISPGPANSKRVVHEAHGACKIATASMPGTLSFNASVITIGICAFASLRLNGFGDFGFWQLRLVTSKPPKRILYRERSLERGGLTRHGGVRRRPSSLSQRAPDFVQQASATVLRALGPVGHSRQTLWQA
jgi:hypothetical protein